MCSGKVADRFRTGACETDQRQVVGLSNFPWMHLLIYVVVVLLIWYVMNDKFVYFLQYFPDFHRINKLCQIGEKKWLKLTTYCYVSRKTTHHTYFLDEIFVFEKKCL